MEIEVREEAPTDLDEYSRIPIAFEVRTFLELRVRDGGLAGFELRERAVRDPFIKDYDALSENRPADWANRFEVANWGVLVVCAEHRRVGGAVIAFNTPGVHMLEGRSDLAALWDIRIHPTVRRRGLGSVLFAAAERWARERGCRLLKIETQNINVAACRFYSRQGCTLGAIHRLAYAESPDEVQLLWYKDLS